MRGLVSLLSPLELRVAFCRSSDRCCASYGLCRACGCGDFAMVSASHHRDLGPCSLEYPYWRLVQQLAELRRFLLGHSCR